MPRPRPPGGSENFSTGGNGGSAVGNIDGTLLNLEAEVVGNLDRMEILGAAARRRRRGLPVGQKPRHERRCGCRWRNSEQRREWSGVRGICPDSRETANLGSGSITARGQPDGGSGIGHWGGGSRRGVEFVSSTASSFRIDQPGCDHRKTELSHRRTGRIVPDDQGRLNLPNPAPTPTRCNTAGGWFSAARGHRHHPFACRSSSTAPPTWTRWSAIPASRPARSIYRWTSVTTARRTGVTATPRTSRPPQRHHLASALNAYMVSQTGVAWGADVDVPVRVQIDRQADVILTNLVLTLQSNQPGALAAAAVEMGADRPLDVPVVITGNHNQGEQYNFTHTLGPNADSIHPCKLYDQNGSTVKGRASTAPTLAGAVCLTVYSVTARDGVMLSGSTVRFSNGSMFQSSNVAARGLTAHATDVSTAQVSAWRCGADPSDAGHGCWAL